MILDTVFKIDGENNLLAVEGSYPTKTYLSPTDPFLGRLHQPASPFCLPQASGPLQGRLRRGWLA